MEVHAHTHTARKKWTHYFWEFFMLFLAVTLGFFVENQREHNVEHQREKQFMQSMIEDIAGDTATLSGQIIEFPLLNARLDSLIFFLNDPDIKNHSGYVYWLGKLASRDYRFTYIDRTINQMKNSGGFRLVRKKESANAITSYYRTITQWVEKLEEIESHATEEYRKRAVQIFDPRIFETMVTSNGNVVRPTGNPPLQSYNQRELMALSGWVHYIKNTRLTLVLRKKELMQEATEVIKVISRDYHLE